MVMIMDRRAVPYPKALPQPPPPAFSVFCMETLSDCVIIHNVPWVMHLSLRNHRYQTGIPGTT